MIVYDVAMKVLDTKYFSQHNISLISGITFIVLFQSGEASTVEGNKHTHTAISKQEAINKEFKAKTYKRTSLSTSLIDLYATKLILHSNQKARIDLSKVTSENTGAAWADATQIY